MCHTPIVIRDLVAITSSPFSAGRRLKDSEKLEIFFSNATIGRNTRLVVPTSGFSHSPGPPQLGNVLGITSPWPSKWPASMVHLLLFFSACDAVISRGNAEWILARWQRPVTSTKALDTLYWAMHSALHWRFSTAFKMGRIGGVFISHWQFYHQPNHGILTF
jgi:hypothetical protein